MERHFFGSRHGKGPSDGENAVVKSHATRAVKASSVDEPAVQAGPASPNHLTLPATATPSQLAPSDHFPTDKDHAEVVGQFLEVQLEGKLRRVSFYAKVLALDSTGEMNVHYLTKLHDSNLCGQMKLGCLLTILSSL